MKPRTLADRLAEVMEDAGVNDEELAKRVSEILRRPAGKRVPKQTIQKIRSGKSQRPALLPEIAQALRVNQDWLRDEKGPKHGAGNTEEDALAAQIRALPASMRAFVIDQVTAFSSLSEKYPEWAELVFSTPIDGDRHQWFMKILEDAQKRARRESSRSR